MAKLLVIHGPNLNLLGTREPLLYGKLTLKDLNEGLSKLAKPHSLTYFQSNAEHEIIDQIQQSPAQGIEFIIINPGALAHTSIALRDALLAINIPFIEVHLTNIYARETFRHLSYLSDVAIGVISGLGPHGYTAALNAALEKLS
jgi:3-dehydroquinate dehydratase-2